MAKGNFGERLRRERELREVSLDEISVATKISGRYLNALENEEWSKLPGGVFTRGFVRSIGRYLGLDEESLLGDYDLARSRMPERMAPPPFEPLPWQPPRWVPPVAGAIIFLLLVAGLIYGWMRIYVRHKTPVNAVAAVVRSPEPAASEPPPGSSAPNSVQSSVQSSPAATPAPAATTTTAAPPESTPTARPAAAIPAAAQKDQPDFAEAQEPLKLTVSTSAATRVRITADGNVKFDARMPAGENLSFTAKTEFVVSAQDSSAVLLDLNGQAMPPIGAPGSSGTIKLGRKNLRRTSHGTSQR
jgi:cytoskeleton protein RodZ